MMLMDKPTFDSLVELTQHPQAFFTLNDLLEFVAANPDVKPLEYAANARLQLDIIGALVTFIGTRKTLGQKNMIENLTVASGVMAMGLSHVANHDPMPGKDIAQMVIAYCLEAFRGNIGINWKAPKWVKDPTNEPPHSTN